jgi:hypothetical protein
MSRRKIMLPLGAVLVVLVVLAVNVIAGGANYGPNKPANPCIDRKGGPIAPRLEPLAERVVLTGLDESACQLGISRERLVLGLASSKAQDDLVADLGTNRAELAKTLNTGLDKGVTRLETDGELPKASALLPDIIDELKLPPSLSGLAGQVPAGVVDSVLPAGSVLHRAAQKIDYATLLSQVNDPAKLEPLLRDAIEKAAIDEARARIQQNLSSGLGGLLN